MVQRGNGAGLAAKAGAGRLIAQRLHGKHLERHAPAEHRVGGQPHLTAAARAEALDDPIMRNRFDVSDYTPALRKQPSFLPNSESHRLHP
jgi:hypothetical protein